MSEQPTIHFHADSNRPGYRSMQAAMDRFVAENLDELNAMQAAAGAPLLADPKDCRVCSDQAGGSNS